MKARPSENPSETVRSYAVVGLVGLAAVPLMHSEVSIALCWLLLLFSCASNLSLQNYTVYLVIVLSGQMYHIQRHGDLGALAGDSGSISRNSN